MRHIGKLFAAGALTVGLAAGAANSATYNVTSILDGTDGGYSYSSFHDQSIWRMNGGTLADPAAGGITPGTWDSVTGAISFGSLLQGAGSFIATGVLALNNSLTSGSLTGISGYLDIVFSGATNIVDGSYHFLFDDWLMGGTGAPNSYDSANNWISLWGDIDQDGDGVYDYQMLNCSPTYNASIGQGPQSTCIGADLRFQVSPAVVPLPAGIVLMLTGLGGFAGLRRFRKKQT